MDLEFIIFIKLYKNMTESLNFPWRKIQRLHMPLCIKISKSYMTYVWFGDFFVQNLRLAEKTFVWRKYCRKIPGNYLNCKQKQLAYFKERSKEQA